MLDSGASNIIGRDEIKEKEWQTVRSIQPITLNTAAQQITVDQTVDVYVQELGDTFVFLLLPECQPVLSMGQLSDANFDFSWRRINGVKTMRIFNETGTDVECFLQDQCPRLYNVTQAKDADRPADSTVENDASPPLSAIKQSFYPQKAWRPKVKPKRCKWKTVRPLPVSASAGDGDASGTDLPLLSESSADELGSEQPSVESEDSDSDESVIQAKELASTFVVLSSLPAHSIPNTISLGKTVQSESSNTLTPLFYGQSRIHS